MAVFTLEKVIDLRTLSVIFLVLLLAQFSRPAPHRSHQDSISTVLDDPCGSTGIHAFRHTRSVSHNGTQKAVARQIRMLGAQIKHTYQQMEEVHGEVAGNSYTHFPTTLPGKVPNGTENMRKRRAYGGVQMYVQALYSMAGQSGDNWAAIDSEKRSTHLANLSNTAVQLLCELHADLKRNKGKLLGKIPKASENKKLLKITKEFVQNLQYSDVCRQDLQVLKKFGNFVDSLRKSYGMTTSSKREGQNNKRRRNQKKKQNKNKTAKSSNKNKSKNARKKNASGRNVQQKKANLS